ncbi:sensor histidine kinase [Streptococcus sp. X16XC17]|uniref:sensor histidine kinase n=1 Tax=unclassified Streptococcus TaxID=2608887 RepID=UPI00066FED59|nr:MULTISPECIES: HAMP domain-containing sensor histidine kinase [unclassified Streptococcus]TCD46418.1 sensor histidine kinase [Streptococcus sp. X16XC17]
MLNKLKKLSHTDNFSYFIRYFAVFTLIFGMMTLIILQLMRSTMYHTSDENFDIIAHDPNLIINFAVARGIGANTIYFEEENSSDQTSKNGIFTFNPEKKLDLNTNYHIILYDSKGIILNQLDNLSGLSGLPLDTHHLGEIEVTSFATLFGKEESYRMMTVEVDSSKTVLPTTLDIKYAAILFNTTQIMDSIETYERTVLLVMVSFWLISIVASLYLAQLTVQPILVSFQKQKDFVENASHELRTPLAVLQNRLEGLFRRPDATIMESSESIASSLEEVRNMRLLTTNLLNLARRDDGLKLEITDVQPAFFDEVFDNYMIMAEENGKHLEFKNAMQQSVRTDKILLKQVMTILFDNALKYTDDDGHIVIKVYNKDKCLIYSVEDDGIGISDSDKQKIFDRFYRVDKARTRQKGGFGLGLALAKQILDTLNGTITVHDRYPKGTIFEVRIPK